MCGRAELGSTYRYYVPRLPRARCSVIYSHLLWGSDEEVERRPWPTFLKPSSWGTKQSSGGMNEMAITAVKLCGIKSVQPENWSSQTFLHWNSMYWSPMFQFVVGQSFEGNLIFREEGQKLLVNSPLEVINVVCGWSLSILNILVYFSRQLIHCLQCSWELCTFLFPLL